MCVSDLLQRMRDDCRMYAALKGIFMQDFISGENPGSVVTCSEHGTVTLESYWDSQPTQRSFS